ncbi:MAG: spermidine synthase [Chloroflexota bacterium]
METLRRPDVRLLLTSWSVLFVELLLIRWIPANVKYVGFFSNFLLMASFLGIGVGILLGRRLGRLRLSPFAPLLFLVTLLVLRAQLNVQVTPGDEIFFGLAESRSADVNFVVLPLVIVLVAVLMTCLALPLGPLLRSMPPLRAYAIDIIGSLAGIASFAGLALLATPPVVWFAVVAVLLGSLALGSRPTRWSAVGATAMLATIGIVAFQGLSQDAWSPYYRISAYDPQGTRVSAHRTPGETIRYLEVDGIPHQAVGSAAAAAGSALHGQVYRWFPDRVFGRVLVIGAGSGTDTALALAKGAEHVDAVEIDPELARIGRESQPERAYEDPRVTVHVTDGRAYMRTTADRYDLILFALTDSLTLVSSTGGIRLESFLYTREALANARDLLTPGGVVVMYNIYREPWLVARLNAMAGDVFGRPPLVRMSGTSTAVIAAGPRVASLQSGPPLGDVADSIPALGDAAAIPTDDWPFLYLRVPSIAGYYLVGLAFLLLLAVVLVAGAARVSGTTIRRFSPHFFVLGIAFLLLETKSLVTFSLLFGTTWVVNALAFFAILASVLLAIVITARWRPTRPGPLYLALFASIALAYLLPTDSLLLEPAGLRYSLGALIAFAPVFFANLVFAYSFRDAPAADMAFASNLLGAMVGGALEYLALLGGYRSLLLVVAGLYAVAFLLGSRWRVLLDVELVPATPEVAASAAAGFGQPS